MSPVECPIDVLGFHCLTQMSDRKTRLSYARLSTYTPDCARYHAGITVVQCRLKHRLSDALCWTDTPNSTSYHACIQLHATSCSQDLYPSFAFVALLVKEQCFVQQARGKGSRKARPVSWRNLLSGSIYPQLCCPQ